MKFSLSCINSLILLLFISGNALATEYDCRVGAHADAFRVWSVQECLRDACAAATSARGETREVPGEIIGSSNLGTPESETFTLDANCAHNPLFEKRVNAHHAKIRDGAESNYLTFYASEITVKAAYYHLGQVGGNDLGCLLNYGRNGNDEIGTAEWQTKVETRTTPDLCELCRRDAETKLKAMAPDELVTPKREGRFKSKNVCIFPLRTIQ